jgi:hypothetical protein
MKLLALLILTLVLGGCTRPGDHPVSSNCSWAEDDNHTLNLQNFADRRHLYNDAVTAEDMAVRWADQHFHLSPEWDRRCYQCAQSLFKGVASHHGVDLNLVRQYSRQRDVVADSITILSFGLIYLAAVYYLVGKLRRRFSADESINYWIMSAVISFGVGLAGVLVGGLWSIVIETYRLNSPHLSFRMNRVPFRQYWLVFLLCLMLAFWLIALIRRKDMRPELQN